MAATFSHPSARPTVRPVLTMKKVDASKVAEAYEKGKFANTRLVDVKGALAGPATIYHIPQISNTQIRHMTNGQTVCMAGAGTTGSHICAVCNTTFSGQGYGLPIRMEQTYDVDFKIQRKYTVVDLYDTIECVYARANNLSKTPIRRININYTDSVSLTRMMARDYCGITTFKPPPPPELAVSNPEYYRQHYHTYVEVPNILQIQTFSQFIQIS